MLSHMENLSPSSFPPSSSVHFQDKQIHYKSLRITENSIILNFCLKVNSVSNDYGKIIEIRSKNYS